jgi:hypothetical protein
MGPMPSKNTVVRNYLVLPCCLLLLNLCVGLVSYKAKMIEDPLVQTAVVMGMVLFGGSLVGFILAPAIEATVSTLHRTSKRRFGGLGEAAFIGLLVVLVFWLYFRMYIMGPQYLLPAEWRNPHGH